MNFEVNAKSPPSLLFVSFLREWNLLFGIRSQMIKIAKYFGAHVNVAGIKWTVVLVGGGNKKNNEWERMEIKFGWLICLQIKPHVS